MAKRMLVDAVHPEDTRVVIADEKQVYEFDYTTSSKKQIKGNIYLAKITRVEPSLQAAFVEYGGGKQGFLPFAEIHPDYYQIPVSDREKLLREAEGAGDDADASEASAPAEGTTADAAELPEMMEIPDPKFSRRKGKKAEDDSDEDDQEDETAETSEDETENEAPSTAPVENEAPSAAPARESMVSFTESDVVEGAKSEDEALVARLSEDDMADEGETKASGKEDGDVETISNEEEEEISSRNKRTNFHRRYKIQEVIKRGQIVLVQVIKEERGNKGVSLTTYLSLAGRYCVLMPNSPKDGGISRKISDSTTRKRLKEILSELRLARGMSVIIRTAGVDRTRAEIRRDFEYLVKLWNTIREETLKSTAPSLIYEESDLIKRAIRDLYTSDIDEVMVEGEEAFQAARDFMKMLLPSHTPRVKQHKESVPILYAYSVEDQLLSMYDPVVKLKSGGYLVINPTEALIAIDVNSGRATSERNIEETATKTNLEAAAEIARQLRLRDLAGLIVIDFIDMMESRNRRNVERALKDALKNDRAKIQLGRISPFGLLEMSRQRLRPSISESHTVQCPHCTGRGVVRSDESMAIQILRSLEKEAATGQWQTLKLHVQEKVAVHLLNYKRQLLTDIEKRHDVHISIQVDHELNASSCTLEKMRRPGSKKRGPQEEPVTETSEDEDSGRSKRRRGRRGGRGRRRKEEDGVEAEELDTEIESELEEITEGESDEDASREKKRRRRGRRGGRGRRRQGEGSEEGSTESEDEDNVASNDNETAGDDSDEDSDDNEGKSSGAGRGRRGGRGRKRIKDDSASDDASDDSDSDEGGEDKAAGKKSSGSRARSGSRNKKPSKSDTKEDDSESDDASGKSLPEFTRKAVVEPRAGEEEELPVAARANATHAPHLLETTERPEGEPPRKGWWQKMIELD